MILYRPVGLQELELIYDSGMKAFPARLPQQPIFYPVLQLEFARQTAADWNVKSGGSAGYVTQFNVEDAYISQFEEHTVGSSQHQEFWIPAEEVEKFNQHIIGHIKVLEAHFGDAFQGFVPEKFSLGGKNAVEQFTLLANSYIYKRMDFYLEIKRNHKAVFLNYPFWQKHEFKNPGLKEKIIKAIKEAWFTSFPQIPLVTSVRENATPEKQTESESYVNAVDEDVAPIEPTNSQSLVQVVDEDVTPVEETDSQSLVNPVEEDVTFAEPTDSQSLANAIREDIGPVSQVGSQSSVNPLDEDDPLAKQTYSRSLINPVHDDIRPAKQTHARAHFSQGLELALSGKFDEAIDELSKAVEEDPDHVVSHTSLGVAFHRLGEDDRALSSYEDALKIDPKYAEAHYFRANILYGQGNVREAIAGYTTAIGLAPELIQAHQKSSPPDRLTDYSASPAEMYWIAKPAYRILDLNNSLETNLQQAAMFNERAAAYYRLWNYEQAIMDYSSSLALQPHDASALYCRGLAYEQLGQFDRALEDYQRAIAVNPQLSAVYINRGVTFGKMGNFRQSITSLTEGIRLAPENPDGYFNRGTSYFQLGDLESAIEDFSMVIQLSPNDEAAYYWRGISNEEAGRQDEAIADYRQFLALSQDPHAREEIEQKLSQWTKGMRYSTNSQSVVPDDRQKTNQSLSEEPDQELDLYDLIVALGDRALNSIWFGDGVRCSGENAGELYAFTAQKKAIDGHDLLRIASNIRQTKEGDFTVFDPDATSHWLFIHAWDGNGFYIEIDDRKSKERLKTHFPSVEEVEGAPPPYEGLLIRI